MTEEASLADQIQELTSAINRNAVSAERDALEAIGAAEEMREALDERERELAAALERLAESGREVRDWKMKSVVDEQALIWLVEENTRLEAKVDVLKSDVARQIQEMKEAVEAVNEGRLPEPEEDEASARQRLEEAAETIALFTGVVEGMDEAREAAETERREAGELNEGLRVMEALPEISPTNPVPKP
jgi:hypothetical protein